MATVSSQLREEYEKDQEYLRTDHISADIRAWLVLKPSTGRYRLMYCLILSVQFRKRSRWSYYKGISSDDVKWRGLYERHATAIWNFATVSTFA